MACIPITSGERAFQMFETLNDRGLRLSVPDLLLNYLMKEAKAMERLQIEGVHLGWRAHYILIVFLQSYQIKG